MIDAPRVTDTAEQRAAVIRFTIPRDEIRNVMDIGIQELLATVGSQGLEPTGPVFSHHLRIDAETFDFELGVPVSGPLAAAGRVQPGRLPAATVARTVYRGPYEGLGTAWRELDAWIAAHGHIPSPDLWESYVAGPESSPDPTEWRTELTRPLAR